VDAVLEVVAAQGELGRFRPFHMQPAWREQDGAAQLRRWLGTTSRRKIYYAGLLVDALDLDRVPAPLDCLLAHV
jgi:hypothetical protein